MWQKISLDIVLSVLKLVGILSLVGFIYYQIQDHGRKTEQNKQLNNTVKVAERKLEVKDEVHQVINRVVVDPTYRERVRDRYDASAKD